MTGAGASTEAADPLLPAGPTPPRRRRPHTGTLLPPRAAERVKQWRRATASKAELLGLPGAVEGGREAAAGALDGFLSAEQTSAPQRSLPPEPPPPPTLRRELYIMMNGNSITRPATVFKTVLTLVIVFNVVTYMLSTMPSLAARFGRFFDVEEAVVSSLFLVEYLIRLWTCVESHKYAGWRGRLKYSMRYSSICDALATFPFFAETAAGLVVPSAKLPNTTIVRMFSIFRVLKTERYLCSFESVGRVLYLNREILATSVVFSGLLVIMTAAALFYADRGQFGSIPSSLYVALGMLTGSAAPERVDTITLRVICSISTIFSVAVCSIPAAMLAWGFEAEAERRIDARREAHRRRLEAERAGRRLPERAAAEAGYTSESSQSSWEEFDSDAEEMSELDAIRTEMAAMRGAMVGMRASMAQLAGDMAALKGTR